MSATALWTEEETRALVGVWGAEDVQSQLDGVARNKAIFEKIASLPSQTMGTIEHGSSARYTNTINDFIRKRLRCAVWTRDSHLAI